MCGVWIMMFVRIRKGHNISHNMFQKDVKNRKKERKNEKEVK